MKMYVGNYLVHGALKLVQLFIDGAGVAVQEPERNSKLNIFSFLYMSNPMLCFYTLPHLDPSGLHTVSFSPWSTRRGREISS